MTRGNRGFLWGLGAQASIINIKGLSFILLYKVFGPFIFFVSLLLMVWGGPRLVVMVFLQVAIIIKYWGCGVWILVTF